MTRAKIKVGGVVQGVGFRPFIYRNASNYGLNGWVRNLGGAGVDIVLEGNKKDIKLFINDLKNQNPPLSKINDISLIWEDEKGLDEFRIKDSSEKGEGTGSIPPDTAMCENCLEDMRNKKSRFYNYWATSCVDCGPRFTVIKKLPYDRKTTSMNEFKICKDCLSEYNDPLDRRYHAQTIACSNCGPKLYLEPGNPENPIKEAAERIKNGEVLAIKGVGGTHITCSTTFDKVKELRKKLNRPNQPFAIMSPSLEKTKEFALVNEKEKNLLESIRKPIVVLRKKDDFDLTDELSPGLHTIGVMLPYSGLHHLLFDYINEPIVMTSANPPGRPMFIKNKNIRNELNQIVDSFLLHNREIVSRCDDSVLRVQGENKKFIRKSRGYAPSSYSVDLGEKSILGLGAEIDNTVSIYNGKECYISQYIGDIDDLETLKYLKESYRHLIEITGSSEPKKIACDLHPDFKTTKLAKEMGNPIQVQHHHAHIASVLAEKNLDEEIIGIAIDGVGYGGDGNIWGGEVILGDRGDYEKLGGLKYQPMPGGDRATKYPARMLAGIMYPKNNLEDFLKNSSFPYGEQEIINLIKQLNKSINSPQTSSAGRFLDAVSCLLNICQKRTYEGEPAMKLEKIAANGEPRKINLSFKTENGFLVLDTTKLMYKLKEMLKTENKKNIAATAQKALAKGLGEIAIKKANEYGIKKIALSGGVAYNSMISREIKKKIEKNDLEFLMAQETPLGDGGVSFGQVIVAGARN